jgi:hypothetical protein
VTEEFRFEQLFGNGAAVDGDERPLGARAGRWMARASTSLPVPLSPRISTLASEAATMRASAIRAAMRLLRKMTPSIQASPPSPTAVPLRRPASRCESCRARSIFSSRIWLSKGLVR